MPNVANETSDLCSVDIKYLFSMFFEIFSDSRKKNICNNLILLNFLALLFTLTHKK